MGFCHILKGKDLANHTVKLSTVYHLSGIRVLGIHHSVGKLVAVVWQRGSSAAVLPDRPWLALLTRLSVGQQPERLKQRIVFPIRNLL